MAVCIGVRICRRYVHHHTLLATDVAWHADVPGHKLVLDAHAVTYADIGICATILSHLCAKLNITTMEARCAASDYARLPTHMTFGKHKGLPLAEVPRDYVRWLLDQQNVDQYVRQAFMALNAKKS